MSLLLTLLQEVDIEDKIKNAPDSQYEIGVSIGAMIPFVVLVAFAYLMYRYSKKNKDNFDL